MVSVLSFSSFARLTVLFLAGFVGFRAGSPPAHDQATDAEAVQQERRRAMVENQIRKRGIKSQAVLAALSKVPRHRFVPHQKADFAYTDEPVSIARGQTISQPYIVALMTELIDPKKTMRVLEIGTGSGYQAAVLAECVLEVDTIEVIPELGRGATRLLSELGYRNVQVRIGDGYGGWPQRAPYDAILLTAAPPERVPQPLLDQLKIGGRLVAPVGREEQELLVFTRTDTGFTRRVIAPVRFVPMTGKAQQP
jgi:protein-L-isoaspartate(D-aspartate) O-methyltransferase